MVYYPAGVDAQKFKVGIGTRLSFFLNGLCEVTAFADNSIGAASYDRVPRLVGVLKKTGHIFNRDRKLLVRYPMHTSDPVMSRTEYQRYVVMQEARLEIRREEKKEQNSWANQYNRAKAAAERSGRAFVAEYNRRKNEKWH